MSRIETRVIAIVGLTAAAVLLAACGRSSRKANDGPRPPDWLLDRTVDVRGGSVQLGFHRGTLRAQANVEAFRISQFPVTRAEFAACVEAGACPTPPAGHCAEGRGPVNQPNFRLEQAAGELPATCVGAVAADAFCRWVGGAMPTVEQWMLAARGPAVRQYSWGDRTPGCAEHPRGVPKVGPVCGSAAGEEFFVGQHPAGASPTGVQDVLLTPGELLRPGSSITPAACRTHAGRDSDRCVIYGRSGSIDSVVRLFAQSGAEVEPSASPYGFRCVWLGEVAS